MMLPWHIGAIACILLACICYGAACYTGLAVMYIVAVVHLYDKHRDWRVVFGLKEIKK